MRILDLFCGAGGAAMGIHQAIPSAEITGVDINEQTEYPFSSVVCDWKEVNPDNYDFIWASPPCQAYSIGGNSESRKRYPKLIDDVRVALLSSGRPFIIENVPAAPLRKDLMLCGTMFDELRVIRHRIFELRRCSCPQQEHKKHIGSVSNGDCIMVCRGGRPGCFGDKEKRNKLKAPTVEEAAKAMGITHMTNFGSICESIPPAYSRYIFKNLER